MVFGRPLLFLLYSLGLKRSVFNPVEGTHPDIPWQGAPRGREADRVSVRTFTQRRQPRLPGQALRAAVGEADRALRTGTETHAFLTSAGHDGLFFFFCFNPRIKPTETV